MLMRNLNCDLRVSYELAQFHEREETYFALCWCFEMEGTSLLFYIFIIDGFLFFSPAGLKGQKGTIISALLNYH